MHGLYLYIACANAFYKVFAHGTYYVFSMGEELDDGFIIEDFIIKYNTYVYYIYIYLIVEEFRHLRGGLC